MRKRLEVKLEKANAALMRTFAGDGSSSLVELRSYRVPPKITFHVLQVGQVDVLYCGSCTAGWLTHVLLGG